MKITRPLLATCALISFATVGPAGTLQVKVTEVQSGNTLVLSNTSPAFKVRLKGIVPPQAAEPFSDVAREHLKMLVLDNAYPTLQDRVRAEQSGSDRIQQNNIPCPPTSWLALRALCRGELATSMK